MKESNKPNLWRLATVHRVEELKTIIRLLPIWAAAILHVASHSHLQSFTIQQARSMNRHLSPSFQIPPASMSIFSTLTVLIGIPLYERLFVPFARRFTGNPVGMTCLLDKRTAIIPISVFWLVPQYCLHGLAEVFMAVGHLEFLYDQSPESMRSTAAALYWIAIAIGNYVSTLMVTSVHKYTGQKRNWLPDRNLNRGRLENYYWLATGIQVINLIYYVTCAWFYTYKLIEEITESTDDEDVESADNTKPLSIDGKGLKEVELGRN